MKKSPRERQFKYGARRIAERADGYYWWLTGSRKEHGPFAALLDAIANMEPDREIDDGFATSAEAADLGIGAAAWTDPDTGLPAEAAILRIEEY